MVLHFISFAVVFWIAVFTTIKYFDIVIASLDYCRENKGMIIFGYGIMPGHVHLIFRSLGGKPSELIRDFKVASCKLNEETQEGHQDRKEWIFWMLKKAGEKNQILKKYQLWQQNNKPIELWFLKVFEQKLDYEH